MSLVVDFLLLSKYFIHQVNITKHQKSRLGHEAPNSAKHHILITIPAHLLHQ